MKDLKNIQRNSKNPIDEYMRVIPVHFNKEHKNMLSRCKLMLEKNTLKSILDLINL
jgi:hypothetical protein